ncbi:MAG TPA: LbtU family siderophore porin [Nitrospirae bacterium]|nr:LbtU family siderophore porin [Nitrospirota bacterium]
MVRKGIFLLVTVLIGVFVFVSTVNVYANDLDLILRVLLRKGIITEKEYQELKKELESKKVAGAGEPAKGQNVQKEDGVLPETISLSGSIYGEYRWVKNREITDAETDSTSDLYLRKIELGVEAKLIDWITASAVFNSEWIGDDVNQGDEKVAVDEATVTLQEEAFPFYLVAGKRTQPFGVFENHLITDPMTQDAYETKRVGITAGYTGPLGLDVSVTVYKGEEQMDHLFESGLFSDTVSRAGEATDDLGSYIVSVSVEPLDSVVLFGGYLSEPGRGTRNQTVNAGVSFLPPFIDGLRFDAEYMKAIDREKYSGTDRQYKEGVFSATIAYEFVLRQRNVIGGGLFSERRAHLINEPLEVALRYEHFDDDGMSEELGVWTVRDRYSAGARYSFYNDEERGFNAFVAGEYRRTEYRTQADMKDGNDEVYLRIGVDF